MFSKVSLSLIGSGSMLQFCVRIAEQNHHMEIQRVFIKDQPVGLGHKLSNLLSKRNINSVVYRNLSDCTELLNKLRNQDLLVSVYNEDKLTPDFLSHFTHAINFHDSQLPRYAGVNAVSWALLAGESIHGVTWHEITEKVDAGDIVAQETFTIDYNWTALDLANRSIELGCHLFRDFLNDFACGKIIRKKQDLANRSYFGRKSIPFGGLFPFLAPVELADKLRRATAYYPMPNRFCMPLIIVGQTEIALSRFTLCRTLSHKEPGTIIGIDENGIEFSIIDGTMTAELVHIAAAGHVRPIDATILQRLKVGSRAFVDPAAYDEIGLLARI